LMTQWNPFTEVVPPCKQLQWRYVFVPKGLYAYLGINN
jgi:hypothetical protein